MTEERDYILNAAAALDGWMNINRKEKNANAAGSTYDKTAIDGLNGLGTRRKPWDDLMYDPGNPKEVDAIRAMIKKYRTENPGERLPPAIAAIIEGGNDDGA